MVLQPTGRWSSDEDGGVEEDGRRRLDAEEDGRRRLDEEEERRRVAFLGGTRRDSGKRRPEPRGGERSPTGNCEDRVRHPHVMDFQTVGKLGPWPIFAWASCPGKRPGSRREFGLSN